MALLIPLVAVLYFIIRDFRHYWSNLPAYACTWLGKYLMVAALFLITGWPLDKEVINFPHRVFVEEMCELAGYYYFAIAGLLALPALRLFEARGEPAPSEHQ